MSTVIFSGFQILLNHLQIRDKKALLSMKKAAFIQLLHPKTFSSPALRPIPEGLCHAICQIIVNIALCKINQEKSNSILCLELLHEVHLMLMDILKGKRIGTAFLGIKTHRNSLYYADIIYRTFFFKICQRNMSGFLINADRCNRRRNLLHQCQMIFLIGFICAVDKLLQTGAAKSPGIPCRHNFRLPFSFFLPVSEKQADSLP